MASSPSLASTGWVLFSLDPALCTVPGVELVVEPAGAFGEPANIDWLGTAWNTPDDLCRKGASNTNVGVRPLPTYRVDLTPTATPTSTPLAASTPTKPRPRKTATATVTATPTEVTAAETPPPPPSGTAFDGPASIAVSPPPTGSGPSEDGFYLRDLPRQTHLADPYDPGLVTWA